jgi:NRPS condensation-like uncharacterized protein
MEEKGPFGMTIFKAHHSFCDGVSVMCMTLALSEEYGREYFVKSADAKWYEELFVKLISPFSIFKIIWNTTLATTDRNFITERKLKSGLTGNLNVSTSKTIDFRLMKALSKTINVTINDIVTTALSCSMNTMFKEKGDKNEHFKLVIPANIRFSFYPRPETIKLENKFAAIPLTVPLLADMQSAYSVI